MRSAPPTISSSRGMPVPVCGGVEAYNERSFYVKYRSQGVQTSFHESTPPTSDSLANTIPPRDTEGSGNARADLPDASKERNIRDISRHSRVLFERIPATQGRRVASSYRLKTTEPPHRRSSLLHAHYKLSAEYRQKRRLRVQNRSAGCVLSCTDTYRQQEVPTVRLRNQGIPVSSTSLWSEHCPQVFTRLGHTVAAYLHHQGILVIPYLDDWLIHHRDSQLLLRHRFQLLNILNMVGLINEAKSELEPVQDIQFPGLQLHLDQGRASLTISKAREIMAHSFTQLGLRSHPTGSSTLEAPTTTLSFFRSDKPAFSTMVFRPPSPCHPTQAMAGPVICHIRNPHPTLPGGVLHFHGRLDPGLGHLYWESQIAGVWTRAERGLHINVLELKTVIFALHLWAAILQGHHVLIETYNTSPS